MSINLKTLDLNLLRMLLAIDETGSVSSAAVKLGLSQPAASNCLARLRQAMGDPLFVRTRQGMRPTSFAEKILPGVRKNFEGLLSSIGEEPDFDPTSTIRRFRLSMSDLGETVFLPPLIERVINQAPNVTIRNLQIPVTELEASLESGTVDLAIGMINFEARGIRSQTLFHETYVPIAAPHVKGSANRIEDLLHFPLIVPAPSASYATDLRQTLTKIGLMQHLKVQTASFGALPHILMAVEAISIVPRQFAVLLQSRMNFRIFPIEITPINTEAKLIWSEHNEDDPGLNWLRQTIVSLFGENQ